MTDYHSEVFDLLEDTSRQYLEVDCGLGAFIPSLVQRKGHKKPIVINPANFEILRDMLVYARNLDINKWVNNRLEILIRRADIIMDPNVVDFINLPLQEAVGKYPRILGVANVVVDNFGPGYYHDNKESQPIATLERKLLRSNGILINGL
ncbi:hypothetical protein COV17_04550 [Candidatus Woesearchaeota archaeon CG10_big_fil_rev_8_21_14_0_10_36_11]|nr:MAG: hypothetical protein COV17_04550 [Candidatus Woesearchaeota archaeon CG10_big_fil_rev_8_21_14_0_10_36_11]